MERFSRQYILKGFGKEGQQKLKNSKVLVIGAGGLGSPALLYLAAAGVGTIGIMDGDLVSISNLNRQVLFGENDIGHNKAESASHQLKSKYPDILFHCIPEFVSNQNALEIIASYDLIIDGSDNFPTRYLVNDACCLLKKPLVFGAIFQNEGQVALLNAKGESSVNYRDLYPNPPSVYEIPNCSETGVLGVLPGIMGTLQASEAIKFLTGYGQILEDEMLYYNLLNNETYKLQLSLNLEGREKMPKTVKEFREMDYALVCGAEESIGWEDALNEIENNSGSLLIDVRDLDEKPRLEILNPLEIPLSQIHFPKREIIQAEVIFLFCQSGIRSLKAVQILKKSLTGKNIYSIKGGIEAPQSPINKVPYGT
ncbi:ThiF family adenylyltransferase [Shivajiella indica]|uniref:ThiF family adenylyltransferase n=1 Tax=Shivajiella indica TaxID=872115 RepID=A0ABW5B668_9BACT